MHEPKQYGPIEVVACSIVREGVIITTEKVALGLSELHNLDVAGDRRHGRRTSDWQDALHERSARMVM
jgi:hypothetical protein